LGCDVTSAVAFLVVIAVKSDISSFAIGSGPRVADEPILLAVFLSVTYQNNSVVDVRINLVAAVENTTIVG